MPPGLSVRLMAWILPPAAALRLFSITSAWDASTEPRPGVCSQVTQKASGFSNVSLNLFTRFIIWSFFSYINHVFGPVPAPQTLC